MAGVLKSIPVTGPQGRGHSPANPARDPLMQAPDRAGRVFARRFLGEAIKVKILGPAILIRLLLALGAMGARLHAQTTRGTITGTVTDETGGVVAGARINVREIDKGLTFEP